MIKGRGSAAAAAEPRLTGVDGEPLAFVLTQNRGLRAVMPVSARYWAGAR